MQTRPKNFSQIFMTTIGIVLLVMALVLNHKHPHNEGIATLPRNSIYQLQLDTLQQAEQTYAANSLKTITLKSTLTANAYTAPSSSTEVTPMLTAAASLCDSIDEQDFALAQQADVDSYNAYQATSKTGDDYQSYLTSIAQNYKDYQAAVTSSGCVPNYQTSQPVNQ